MSETPTPDAAAPGSQNQERAVVKLVDIAGIMHAIPHRYPLLLIDRVVDVHPNVSAIGIKNV
ncbi:MAG TPA: hypothetical protein PLI12_01600, partial [Acetobacteraceae bacterium]|nr:hypothetical protein [Acetobacteraceae bacterium]